MNISAKFILFSMLRLVWILVVIYILYLSYKIHPLFSLIDMIFLLSGDRLLTWLENKYNVYNTILNEVDEDGQN